MDIVVSKKRPIGVFDSGVGGLTILKELEAHFPNEDFIYYADTEHVPYGNKTAQQITEYSDKAIKWMIKHHDVKAVVIACHTSSACCGTFLQKKYTVPIIDTINATVEAVMRYAPPSLLLLATERTIKSKIYERSLYAAGYKGFVIPQACPGFVPLIEQGIVEGNAIRSYIIQYCMPFLAKAIIYGCTHYPLIENAIKQVLKTDIIFINPAFHIVEQLKQIVHSSSLSVTKGSINFHVTGNKKQFLMSMAQLFKK